MKNLLIILFIFFSLVVEAQVSKLIDGGGTGFVTKSSTYYAKVFKRKKGAVTEFIWYTTDVNGNKLPRGGQVKGTPVYSSLASAEAAIPASYTAVQGGVVGGGGGSNGIGTVVGDFVVQFQKGMTGDESYQYDKPTHISEYNNNETIERLLITVTNDYKLVLTVNTVGFADAAENMRFKVDVDATTDFSQWMTKADLETKDFSALKGHDILVIMAHKPNANLPLNCVYTLVHLKGDATSSLPSFFKRSSASVRLPQAPYSFPDVTPLSSKVNIMQFQQLDNDKNNVSPRYLNKGYTIGTTSDSTQNFTGIYDDWAYGNGWRNDGAMRWEEWTTYRNEYKAQNNNAEPPYSDAHKYNVNWVKTHTIQDLFFRFNQYVIQPNNNKKFLFLDYEFVAFSGLDDQDFVNKMGTLFMEFHNRNPNTLFTSYVNADPISTKYNIKLTAADVNTYNAKYGVSKDNFSQIATGFYKRTVEYLNVLNGQPLLNANGSRKTGNMGEYIEPVVELYMHNLDNTNLYSAINAFELSAQNGFKPIAFIWGLNEGLAEADWRANPKYFRATDGTMYSKQVKPPVPASYMWNTALMSNFFGRGAWIWDEPLPFLEGFDYWSFAFPISGGDVAIPDRIYNRNNKVFGTMHYAAQTAYDYATWAIQRMIHNRDIIDNTQDILRPEYSIDNGSTYKTGNDLLPATAEFNKLPLVRIKRHATLNEYVIFAVNHHLKTWETQTLKVKVADKIITVVLKGQFAEFERIK
jgi:hypothetical protein